MIHGLTRGPSISFHAELRRSSSIDEALTEVRSSLPKKVLFEGEEAGLGAIASYAAGWMASEDAAVIVLDGANRFDPYGVSSFARKALIPPEVLLKRIRIARAFTCYQMATLMDEKLPGLLRQEEALVKHKKPRIILLGPITTFLDEDIPEREVGPLLERALRGVNSLAEEGIPFLLFQASVPPRSKRAYLMKRLFQFSNWVWKISLDDEGPKVLLEKSVTDKYRTVNHIHFKSQVSNPKSQIISKSNDPIHKPV